MPDTPPKSVLITGCSSGIGRALALEFRRTGYRTFATARRPESVAELEREGYEALQLDVTNPESVEAAIQRVVSDAGRLDVLVNNAGRNVYGPTAEVPVAEVRDLFETNVLGALATVQAAFPHMAKEGAGTIINVGSVIGVVAVPYSGGYCASKAALHMLSDSLRLELAPFGIDVVTVQPGAVKSELSKHGSRDLERFAGDGSRYSAAYEDIVERAGLAQQDPTDNREFARKLVGILTKNARPPAIIRLGRGAKALPAARTLPTAIRDKLLARRFNLNKLG